jgi:hypothetical protein
MLRRAHARSDRSPLRRRLERTILFAALLFFIVLGSTIYQNVSRGTPSPRPTAVSLSEPPSSNLEPGNAGPRETESVAVSPNEPAPNAALPSKTKPSDQEPSAAGSTATASSEPPPLRAPPPEIKQVEEAPSTAATITPQPEAALLSPASLDCATGSPTSWEFANVELIDSASGRATSLVTSCRVSAVSCQNAVIVGVGVASTKGTNAIESARALRRGINLASALKKDLQARCATSVTISAYVLNLGRYNDEQERDEPDQRKVIALVASGSNDADKAAADAVVTYAKSDPKIAHYPICALFKLDDAGQPTPVSAQQNNCGEQTGRTASRQ